MSPVDFVKVVGRMLLRLGTAKGVTILPLGLLRHPNRKEPKKR